VGEIVDAGVADATTGVLVAVGELVGLSSVGTDDGGRVGVIVGVAVTTTVTSIITGGTGVSDCELGNAVLLATSSNFALVGVSVMVMTVVMVVIVALTRMIVIGVIMRMVVSVIH
jgi:hypothetical protein